ncbi:MAG: lytic transglycosylase domain-containing protein [Candidatus Binatia bacterium]|jgi:soluble lytic murein transglycosylase-like protein
MTRSLALAGLILMLAGAAPARARQVDVPLQYDFDFIRQALVVQVYTGPNGKAVLWDDGTGCGFLKLYDPEVTGSAERIRVVTRGEGRVGTPIGDECLAPVQWDGFLEVFEQPQISADQHVLQFRVVESNIYDKEFKKPLLTGKIWDLVKRYVQPSFEAVRIDLKPAIQDVRDLLPLIVARGDQARIEQMLDSLHLADATVTDKGVKVMLAFAVSAVTPVAAPTPEPTLTPEELQRWEEALDHWDAFFTFVIKQFGNDTSAQDLRQAFFDVLMDSRYDLLEALAPPYPGAPDPTKQLFLKAWERLVPVVRRSATTLPGATALRYLSFIAAGDALAALDEIGPEIGVEISADGLRRLARIIAPLSTEDSLSYSTAVDAELRQLFGFGPPLPPPDLSAEPTNAEGNQAWWRNLLVARIAIAAVEPPAAKTLEQWLAPQDADSIDAYLRAVREALDEIMQKSLASGGLDGQYHHLYRLLVLAAAWQESCWRQFVRERGKITYMRSAIGSIGMMQVNEHVWRGFYDLRGLRWDIRYNSRAGGDILLHYLKDYAIPHNQPGVTDFLARATYAVYNGGPGHLKRFLDKKTKKSLQRIDELFWEKFKAVTAGKEAGLARCLVGGAAVGD